MRTQFRQKTLGKTLGQAFGLLAALSFVAGTVSAALTDGAYPGEAQGKNGPVKVSVEVKGGKIADVKITEHKESAGLSDPALTTVPKAIVAKQSADVDAVTGATVTSEAIKKAVSGALLLTGGVKPGAAKAAPEEKVTVDVVVLGSGAAGMNAAATLADQNVKNVLVLEKLGVRGGSTGRSSGCILRATDDRDAKNNFPPEIMVKYIMGRSNGKADLAFVKKVAEMSNATYHRLVDLGVPFTSFEPVYQGYSPLRLENPNPKGTFARTSGMLIVDALYKHATAKNVKVRMNTAAESLIIENGRVTGVKAKTEGEKPLTVNAKAVVIATGGFDHNLDLQRQYARPTVGLLSQTSPGNTGDGLAMAMKVGADTVFRHGKGTMISVRADATAGLPASFLYVDGKGLRFVNEEGFYDDIGDAMLKNDSQRFHRVYDSSASAKEVAALEEAAKAGKALKADTLDELADLMRVDRKNFAATVDRYNHLQQDVDFGKSAENLKPIAKAPFFAVRAEPEIVATFGGLKVNENAQVIDKFGKAIPGLYAVGEVANGQIFDTGYAYTGTAIQFAVSAGQIAGEEIAKTIK